MFSSGCRRGILALGSGGGFNPLTLFAAGEQGGWWDPADFSTLFQDSAGTTPVTAAGQPVGLIRDKSGRGNHRVQGIAASRPTLQVDASGFFYLSYDGVDDFNSVTIDLSGSAQATIWAGVNKQSDATTAVFLEGTSGSGIGIFAPATGATGNYGFRTYGGTAVNNGVSATAFAAPIGNVLTVQIDNTAGTAAAQIQARINGATAPLTGTTLTGTGTLPNQLLFFGRRGGTTLPFNGREYGTILRGATTDAAVLQLTERFIAAKMGVLVP